MKFLSFLIIICLGVISCKKDDDSNLTPVYNESYLVEIDTFNMFGANVNSNYPCNNHVLLKNFGRVFDDFRINSHPSNFDPNNSNILYTGIFRVFPDSVFECIEHAADPPFSYNYINVDLLYFKVLQ
ncbi:MAG: hypothetical protein RH860_11050 [Cytophagales bacterium]